MSKNVALILAAFMLVSRILVRRRSLAGFGRSATLFAQCHVGAGLLRIGGFHREYGHCIRNGTAYVPPVVVTPHVVVTPPVVVAPHYAPHVVVAPHYTRPAVVAPSVCPHGYYYGANGHCVPY